MMTSSNGNIFRVTGFLCGEFTGHRWIPRTQRPVTRSFDVFFDLRPNQQLSKQSRRRRFEMPMSSCSLWRYCNAIGEINGRSCHRTIYASLGRKHKGTEVQTKSIICRWHFQMYFWMEIILFFLFLIQSKSVAYGRINNKPALVQVMAWHWIWDKLLS